MVNRNVLIITILLTALRAYTLDLSLDVGVSSFRYAENSINNKEDLYEISSLLTGLTINSNLKNNFKLYNFIGVQVPYSINITDALGSFGYDYINEVLFFGGNIKTGISYNLISLESLSIDTTLFMNWDLFYFRDAYVNNGDIYWISAIGTGLGADIKVPIDSSWAFGLKGAGAVNYLPLLRPDTTLLWSNNILFTVYISYSI